MMKPRFLPALGVLALTLACPAALAWAAQSANERLQWRLNSLSILLGLLAALAAQVAISRVVLQRVFPEGKRAPAVLPRGLVLAAAALATLALCARLSPLVSFCPINVDGESAEGWLVAEQTVNAAREGRLFEHLRVIASHYNIGLGPLLAPVMYFGGLSPNLYKAGNIFFWVVVLAGFAIFFLRRARTLSSPTRPSAPLVVVLPALLSTLALSILLLRWHALAVSAALGIYLVVDSFAPRRDRSPAQFGGGLALLALSLVLYHGNLIFLPALAAISLWEICGGRWRGEKSLRSTHAWITLGVSAGVFSIWLLWRGQSGLFHRAQTELGNLPGSDPRGLERYFELCHQVLEITRRYFSWPMFAAGTVGFCGCLARLPHDRVALTTLALFFTGLGTSALCQQLGDPGQNCWYLLPVMALIAYGLLDTASLLGWALPPALATAAMAALAAGAVLPELGQFDKHELYRRVIAAPLPEVTGTQFALAIADIAGRRGPAARATLCLLPGPDIAEERGGFFRQLPLRFYDSRPRTAQLAEYASEGDLAAQLRCFEAGETGASQLIVYLSLHDSQKERAAAEIEPVLAGHAFVEKLADLPDLGQPRPIRCRVLTLRRPDATTASTDNGSPHIANSARTE